MVRAKRGVDFVLSLAAVTIVASGSPAQSWPDLSPTERYGVLRRYQQHQAEPREKQQTIEERYRRWQQMPEEEREKLRDRYRSWQQLPAPEREEIRRKYRGE